jgi:hypothetical protein
MTTRKIKIVKRDAPVPEPVPPPEELPDQAATDRRISNSVKKWISERRESSLAEKASEKRYRKIKFAKCFVKGA